MTDRLLAGQTLQRGAELRAAGGRLIMQSDGNLVLYSPSGAPIWATDTQGKPATRAVFQRDGNLVIRAPLGVGVPEGTGYWDSGSAGRGATLLILQPDGNLVWYRGAQRPENVVTSTQTNGWRKAPHWQTSGGGFLKSIGRVASGAVNAAAHAVSHPAETVSSAAHVVTHAVTHPLQTAKTLAHDAQVVAGKAAPVLEIVAAGASVLPIPGVSQAVAAGLSATAAIGRGKSLADIGLAAARGALPGGPLVAAGWDLGVGLAKGGTLTSAVLNAARAQVPGGAVGQAAFDVGLKVARGGNVSSAVLAKARDAIPPGPYQQVARKAFDAAVIVASKAAPASAREIKRVRAAIVNPEAKAAFDAALIAARSPHAPKIPDLPAKHAATLPPKERAVFAKALLAAAKAKTATPREQAAAHAVVRSRVLRRSLSPRARTWVKATLETTAARALAKDVQGLEPGGRIYVVEPNDSAWRIAQNLTGNGNAHYRELFKANPKKPLVGSGSSQNFKSLSVKERLNVPSTWKLIVEVPPAVSVQPPAPAPAPVAPKPSPAPAPVAPKPSAPASADFPDVKPYNVTCGAGETWRVAFVLSRAVTEAEWQTVQQKLTAALVLPPSTREAFELVGRLGAIVIRFGNPMELHVGTMAKVTVEASSPSLMLTEAKKLADAPAATPSVQPPTSAPAPVAPTSLDDPAVIAQAKALLVAWEHTDGLSAAGLPDYGGRPEDVSPIWGPRDTLELAAFCGWTNAHGGALPLVGDLTQQKLDALVAWSEAKAAAVQPGGAPVVSAPVTAPPPTAPVAMTPATETIPETSISGSPVAEAGMGGGSLGLLIVLGLGGALLLGSKKKVSRAAA